MILNYTNKTNQELERLIKNNDPAAMHELARRLVQGEGIAEDNKRGIELARQSEALGYAPADTVIGYCYFYGKGVEEDKQKGFAYFHSGAVKGHDAAQYNMGIAYERGTVIPQDYALALEWYQERLIKNFPSFLQTRVTSMNTGWV